MGGLCRGVRRLLRDSGGAALIEFAMIFPLLLTMFLGSFILSDMIACNRKVTVAARELTDVTSRFASLQASDLSTILAASSQVMVPYKAANTSTRVTEIKLLTTTTATVLWSQGSPSSQALAKASTITLPANAFAANMIGSYFIVGEVWYAYTPVLKMGSANTINMYDITYMTPRVSVPLPCSNC